MHIIVLGMHRSGTSTVTRLINLMGAHAGHEDDLIAANDENPKGFWERQDVIDCNDALLAHHGCHWHDLSGWPLHGDETDAAPPESLQETMQTILARLDEPAVIKDPRLCHTLPYWLPHLNHPVFVVVHRDPLEVARSLQTRNQMPLFYGLALWEYAIVGVLNAIDPARTIVTHYRDIIERPVSTAGRLYDGLAEAGVSPLHALEAETVTDFIEPALYRSRAEAFSPTELMTGYQARLADDLAHERITCTAPLTFSRHAQEIMGGFAAEYATRMELHTQKEAMDRAMTTVEEQEARISELLEQTHLISHELDELKRYVSTLEPLAHECKAIRQTRWWRLRERLLAAKARLSL